MENHNNCMLIYNANSRNDQGQETAANCIRLQAASQLQIRLVPLLQSPLEVYMVSRVISDNHSSMIVFFKLSVLQENNAYRMLKTFSRKTERKKIIVEMNIRMFILSMHRRRALVHWISDQKHFSSLTLLPGIF